MISDPSGHLLPNKLNKKQDSNSQFHGKLHEQRLSPCRTHSTIPFHHSSPVIVDYLIYVGKKTLILAAILSPSKQHARANSSG